MIQCDLCSTSIEKSTSIHYPSNLRSNYGTVAAARDIHHLCSQCSDNLRNDSLKAESTGHKVGHQLFNEAIDRRLKEVGNAD